MTVVVINAKKTEIENGELSYEQLITSLGYDPKRVVTVTWVDGDRSGCLTFGQSLKVTSTLKINAAITGNA